jgi:hypothetical protein
MLSRNGSARRQGGVGGGGLAMAQRPSEHSQSGRRSDTVMRISGNESGCPDSKNEEFLHGGGVEISGSFV